MSDFDSSQEVKEINKRIQDSDQARRIIRRLSDYWDTTEGWRNDGRRKSRMMSEEEVRKFELKVLPTVGNILRIDRVCTEI